MTLPEVIGAVMLGNIATISFLAGCWRVDKGYRGAGTWIAVFFPMVVLLVCAIAMSEAQQARKSIAAAPGQNAAATR